MKVQNYLNLRGGFQWLMLLGICLPLLTITSCKPDSTADWSPTFAGPLVNSTLTISDILDRIASDSSLFSDDDGLIYFTFENELFDYSPADLFQLDYGTNVIDNEVPFSPALQSALDLNGGASFSFGQGVLSIEPAVLNPDGSQFNILIDSMYLYEGDLLVNINSTMGHGGYLDIQIPNMVNADGEMFMYQLEWPENVTTGASTASLMVPLNGYFIDFTQSTDNDPFNHLDVDMTINIVKSDYIADDNDNITFTLELDGMDFELVYGDFGPGSYLLGKDTIDFNPFTEFVDADFYLSDPRINLRINNGIGLGNTNSFVEDLMYIDNNGSLNEVLYNPDAIQPMINAPVTVGQFAETFEQISNEDGDLSAMMSPSVRQLIYGIYGVINNNPPNTQSFIHRDYGVSANLDVEIPMYGRIGDIDFTDTLDFDLGEQLAEVDSLVIKTNMESYFPANAYLQIYFLDADKNLLDSLYQSDFDLPLIQSPEIGPDGKPIDEEPVLTVKEALVSRSTVSNMVDCNYLVLRYSFETADFEDGTEVKLFDEYYINAKLGFQATGRIEF
jgi:hypothetical protein